jgi:hypothetical protein
LHLSAVRGGVPDVIEGVGHVLGFYPDEAAAYISDRLGRSAVMTLRAMNRWRIREGAPP